MTALEDAFEHYQATVRRAAAEREWTLFAGLFTEDADYLEHAYGRLAGRAEIEAWSLHVGREAAVLWVEALSIRDAARLSNA